MRNPRLPHALLALVLLAAAAHAAGAASAPAPQRRSAESTPLGAVAERPGASSRQFT